MPVSPGVFVLSSLCVDVGEDSRFFALLGPAPQEPNTARPERSQTDVLEIARTKSQHIFY
jgi:hypothetical protein